VQAQDIGEAGPLHQNTNSPWLSCRWPRTSMTSILPASRSTRA
jgi:hypothetical protein